MPNSSVRVARIFPLFSLGKNIGPQCSGTGKKHSVLDRVRYGIESGTGTRV